MRIAIIHAPLAIDHHSRQRKEYVVFQQLLQISHLSERLLEVSEEECIVIADLVCLRDWLSIIGSSTRRFRKAYLVQGWMI